MRNEVRFTEDRVAGFVCPAGKKYGLFWDAETPGLGARVTHNGVRSYVYQSRLHGKDTVRVTIGDVRSWALKKARVEARRLATLIDRGIDPRNEAEEKRVQAVAERMEGVRRGVMFSDVWQTYIEANKKNWGERHYNDHVQLAQAGGKKKLRGKGLTKPGPLAVFLPLKLHELTSDRIARWLKHEVPQRRTSARRSFKLLQAFVRWTHDTTEYRGVIPADACTARPVTDEVPEPRAKQGDCLQREQLPSWFAAVRRLSNPVISAYLQGLLLTGPRREELASLRWADVDFSWNSLTLRDKIEGERKIPLTTYVASLLAALPRRNEWVFSSPAAEGGRLVESRIAHNAALNAAGLPHISLHGLRRSFGTLAEWVEIPTGIVAQIQGHKPSAIAEKHYRRRPLDLLRMWHEKLETWILEQGGVPFTRPGDKARLGVVNEDGSVTAAG